MYQFYYAGKSRHEPPEYKKRLEETYRVGAVRPSMWEEHCLECSVPQCYDTCAQYEARSDGRCKRFYYGIEVREEPGGCCGQAARVRFRRWGNLMTILFPGMLSQEIYRNLTERNQGLGNFLGAFNRSPLPTKVRWEGIRTLEYLRRRRLRNAADSMPEPDAFVFHGFSFERESFRLIAEIYRDGKPVFRFSLDLNPGENLIVLEKPELASPCWQAGNLLKIYPENNLEAEIEILWCDFVQGEPADAVKPAGKVKCLVWDLDHTLWDGILIETDRPEELSLRPGVLDLIHTLDERGIVQSVASKNDYEAAWPVLEKLGISEYFLYPQIHWGAKSASLRAIAKDLNIGVDSVALIDDSEFERSQVMDSLPQVRCYQETEIQKLPDYPEFRTVITQESRNRRAMYRAEEHRNRLMREENADTIDFLRKCELCVTIFTPKSEEERLRCYELVNRTNQLNMSGRKYSREDFDSLLARTDLQSFSFSCEDKYGSYGIVGFGQCRMDGGVLHMNEFAMSCRVAGKYVESAVFGALLEDASCRSGSMTIVRTKKNGLLRDTLNEIGFDKISENTEYTEYRFTAELKNRNIVKAKVIK